MIEIQSHKISRKTVFCFIRLLLKANFTPKKENKTENFQSIYIEISKQHLSFSFPLIRSVFVFIVKRVENRKYVFSVRKIYVHISEFGI